jgi:hypothetical protein
MKPNSTGSWNTFPHLLATQKGLQIYGNYNKKQLFSEARNIVVFIECTGKIHIPGM